jgi:hypothetical protein
MTVSTRSSISCYLRSAYSSIKKREYNKNTIEELKKLIATSVAVASSHGSSMTVPGSSE